MLFSILLILMLSNSIIAATTDNLEFDRSSSNFEIMQNSQGYRTYESAGAELREIAEQHPNLAQLFGDKGETYEGRTIWVLKVSDNPDQDEIEEPDVLIIGAHHGDEWIGNEQAFYIIHYLIDNYGKDPRATWLVDNREFWFVPMANPDGTVYSMNVEMWRKNRSPNYPSEKTPLPWDPEILPTSYGTDLNRNYGYHWGETGSGELPRSGTYEGSDAFSELESQAIRDLVESQDFTVSVDYHSGVELILYPWGYTSEPPADAGLFIDVGTTMSEFTGYPVQQGYELYETSGSTIDWFYGEHNILAYTIEISSNKRPPFEELEEIYLPKNTKASLYLAEIAASPDAGAEIEIIHDPLEEKTDEGPYTVAIQVLGANIGDTVDSRVDLYYKAGNDDYQSIRMVRSSDPSKSNEWVGQIPTQAPNQNVSYFFTVTSQNNRISSPNILDVYSFRITESELTQTDIFDWAAMVIMMVLIFTVIWGGFIYSVKIAIRAEKRKMHDYKYTLYND
jgi:hypothetical protein